MTRNDVLSFVLGISICFVANTVGREVIINGEEAGIDQFPYQATLLFNGVDDCGGGIIGHSHILTAAHCVVSKLRLIIRNKISLTVLVGTSDIHVNRTAAEIIEVTKIFTPKEFGFPLVNSTADIAVLKLKRPLKLSKHVTTLELPRHETNFYGKTAKIAGVGWNWIHVNASGEIGGNTDTRLRFAEADVLHTDDCQKAYASYPFINISDKRICARVKQTKYKGVCAGDSGSPLVYEGKIVIGILSVSPFGCSERTLASIYTRVSNFLHFIDDAMHDRNHENMRVHETH